LWSFSSGRAAAALQHRRSRFLGQRSGAAIRGLVRSQSVGSAVRVTRTLLPRPGRRPSSALDSTVGWSMASVSRSPIILA
jgi:hypothetical protein